MNYYNQQNKNLLGWEKLLEKYEKTKSKTDVVYLLEDILQSLQYCRF